MIANVYHQERYSRSELLLRAIFGFFYIVIPHGFLLFFMGIWSAILQFLSFWIILFTGKYPESFFEYQVGYLRWSWRVSARLLNLADGYPAFGISGTDEYTELEIYYLPESNRATVIARAFFGWLYVLFPHLFILSLLGLVSGFITFIAFWVVLFTGSYPRDMFAFVLNIQRWGLRVNAYMMYLTDVYPPFSLEPDMSPYFAHVPQDNIQDDIDEGKEPEKDEFV